MMYQLPPVPSSDEWVPWFAWFPIITQDRALVWLETVMRRWNPDGGPTVGDFSGHSFPMGEWEYKS